MPHAIPRLLALALLLCACGLAGAVQHKCIHDQIAQRQAREGISVVRTGNGTDGVLAYSVLRDASWQPLRIGVFSEDLNDASKYCTAAGQVRPDFLGGSAICTTDDILTTAKKATLLNEVVPAAVALHAERLLVQRVSGDTIVVPTFSTGTLCGQFTVPASHTTTGVSGYDFVLYVSAGPTGGNTIAWATTCATLTTRGRPVAGVSNISPKYIIDDRSTERVVAHEMLHALGFSFGSFDAQGMIRNIGTLRGKPNVLVVTSPNVVEQTQKQLGCKSAVGMELEDQGGSGTAGSHWKRRNAKDEIMSGIAGVGYYTALTIAAMEDLGFYKGNYAKAEAMAWGRNVGCKLLTDKCVKSGVSQERSMFCTDRSRALYCDSSRQSLGSCVVSTFQSNLPSYFQYFSDPRLGGGMDLMDYCPAVQEYTNTGCTDGTVAVMPGSVVSASSRCFDATGLSTSPSVNGVCAPVQCDAATKTYQVKFSGMNAYATCTPCQTITFSGGGLRGSVTATCAPYEEVCEAVGVNPSDIQRCPNAATVRAGALMVWLLVASVLTGAL